VQDAFLLYRTLHQLTSPDKALAYLRVSVVNGCRSVHRRRRIAFGQDSRHEPAVWSAESAVMAREDWRLTLRAVARAVVLSAYSVDTRARLKVFRSWRATRHSFCQLAPDPSGRYLLVATESGFSILKGSTGRIGTAYGPALRDQFTDFAW
jgi:hypothetical protein